MIERLVEIVLASDNTHDERVRNGRFDVQRLFVQGFQLLIVFLRRVHLDF